MQNAELQILITDVKKLQYHDFKKDILGYAA